MKNFEHEVKEIRNRLLRYYIYFDYFHDSIIKYIGIDNTNRNVRIQLSCEREWKSCDYDENIRNPEYEYTLYFKDSRYFEYEHESNQEAAEYINGRFKNSTKLADIIKTATKKYYHLRIQLSNGIIDLIFNGFEIEKAIGSIAVPRPIENRWYFDAIRAKYECKDIDTIRTIAVCGDWIERSETIVYLGMMKDKDSYRCALQGLDDEDIRIAAVYVLGELGYIEALEHMIVLLNDSKIDIIEKKHIKDSIDKILYKQEAKGFNNE